VLSRLTIAGRFVAYRALSGTSEGSFGSRANAGPLRPCSDLTPSDNGGVVDPTSVERCNPAANDRRLDYSDFIISANLPKVARVESLGLDLSTGLRVTLPASAQSRYATLRFGLGGSLGVSRGFFNNRLRLGYSLGLTKFVHGSTTAGLSPRDGVDADEAGSNPSSGVSGVGISNLYADPSRLGGSGFLTSFSFLNGLTASVPLGKKWSSELGYSWTDGFTYAHRCVVDVAGQTVDTCKTGAAVAAQSGSSVEGRGHRRGQIFMASVNYQYRPWLGFSMTYLTWSPREKPDTSYRQGFISTDYNAFTSLLVGATISLEELAQTWREASP
jgi:hypothetical protein